MSLAVPNEPPLVVPPDDTIPPAGHSPDVADTTTENLPVTSHNNTYLDGPTATVIWRRSARPRRSFAHLYDSDWFESSSEEESSEEESSEEELLEDDEPLGDEQSFQEELMEEQPPAKDESATPVSMGISEGQRTSPATKVQNFHSSAGDLCATIPEQLSRKRKRAASVPGEFEGPQAITWAGHPYDILLRDQHFRALHYHAMSEKLATDIQQQNDEWKAAFDEENAAKLKWKQESEKLLKLWVGKAKKVLKLEADLVAQQGRNEELLKKREEVERNGDAEELKMLGEQLEAGRQEKVELKRLLEVFEENKIWAEELAKENKTIIEELVASLFNEQNMRTEALREHQKELAGVRAENEKVVKGLRQEVDFERRANKRLRLDHEAEFEGQAQAVEVFRKNMEGQKPQTDQLLKKIQKLDQELTSERKAGRKWKLESEKMKWELEGARKTNAELENSGIENLKETKAAVAKLVAWCYAGGMAGDALKKAAAFAADEN